MSDGSAPPVSFNMLNIFFWVSLSSKAPPLDFAKDWALCTAQGSHALAFHFLPPYFPSKKQILKYFKKKAGMCQLWNQDLKSQGQPSPDTT